VTRRSARRGGGATRLAVLAAGLLAAAAAAIAREGPEALRGLAYDESAAGDPQRSLDLFLPEPGAAPSPLLAFVASRFWSRADDPRALERSFVEPLRERGAAVALIRHRLSPEHVHPTHARDVARAVAFLFEHAGRFGIDRSRVFLGGHASGAHLASLVALDPAYLAERGVDPGELAGVVAISGIYDLDPGDAASAEERGEYARAFGEARRAASPIRRARAGAPPFLVLAAVDDVPGYAAAAREFAEALRAAGQPRAEAWFAPGVDHVTILDLRLPANPARVHLLAALGLEPLPPELQELASGVRYWHQPHLSSEGFALPAVRLHGHDADERFLASVRRIFTGLNAAQSRTWTAERYEAVDLFEWLGAQGEDRVGSGPYLTITNARREKTFWRLEEIRPYEPVIVVAIDGERNLFRIRDLHRALREYSWQDPPAAMPAIAAPLGAFVYFRRAPPAQLAPPTYTTYALTSESFRLSREDPLAPLRDLPDELLAVLTHGNGCVYCHELRGVGARAGHLRLTDGELVGGFALPLESYPAEVWRRFVFEQEAVAAEIGASPNPIPAEQAPRLFELVERARGEVAR
jgi:acetyl esterase/lipase